MKITTLILLSALMQVSASGLAQKLNLVKKEASLEQIFQEINIQTGYAVFYADKTFDDSKKIDVSFKGASIHEVMRACLQNQGASYIIEQKVIVIRAEEQLTSIQLPSSDDIRVSGKILDEKGEGLPGAFIKVKGTSYTISVGSGGVFSINIPGSEAILIISYLGYKTKEVVVSGADVDLVVRMEPAIEDLKEVVVISTGYQTLPQERATGSFEKIDNKLFNRAVGSNVIKRLDGIASGLLFDKKYGEAELGNLTIRGLSTLESNKTPLVVLDNFPYEGNVENINPNDIESITILKDAAAASIWGVRAGNGVIVITTKKGRYDKPMQVSMNANTIIDDKPDLFYLPQMKPTDYIDVEEWLFEKGRYDSDLSDTYSWSFVSPVVDILADQRDGMINATTANARIEALGQYDTRNDYLKYVYRKAIKQQYAMNLNGGSKTLSYIVSAGYDKNLTNLVTAENNRLTLRSDLSFKPIKNLEIQWGTLYTQTKHQTAGLSSNVFYSPNNRIINPYTRLADGQGNPLVVGRDYRASFASNPGDNRLLNWEYKPLADMEASSKIAEVNDLILNMAVRYRISDVFSADVNTQFGKGINKTTNWQGQDSYYTRNLINLYTQAVGAPVIRPIPLGGIVDENNGSANTYTLRGQLNANRSWGVKHHLAAIAGLEQRENHALSNAHKTYGYNDENLSHQNVDFINYYAAYTLPQGGGVVPNAMSYLDQTFRFTSLYANAAYTYDDRYTLSASARKDASNLFGVKTNLRGVPLWSAGAAWTINKEPFYQSDLLPLLKLRATFGYNGNANNAVSAYSVLQYRGPSPFTSLPWAVISNPANGDLRWEKVGVMNIGLDFGFKNNRLSGSLEYFTKHSKDIIYTNPLGYSTGFSSMRLNAVNMEGKGLDLTLHSKNFSSRSFNWNTDFILSYNENKVTKFTPLNAPFATDYISATSSLTPIIGKPLYAVFSYKWAGLDPQTGDPQGYDDKGVISKDYGSLNFISTDGLQYHGSAVPVFFGAFRNTVSWKEFSVSANIVYKFNYYFRRTSINYDELFYNSSGHSDYAGRWQKTGDELTTNVPSMAYPNDYYRDQFYSGSSTLISKGDHVRLQDMTAAYNIDKSNRYFKNIQIYTNISNLGILWRANKQGLDPDFGNGFPAPKTIAFGINANF